MTRILVRRAGEFDCRLMAELLQAIIDKGGTTAIKGPISAGYMRDWMSAEPDLSAWYVAESDQGDFFGFQTIGPNPKLPGDVCDIATFTRVGNTGHGVGSALFAKMVRAAQKLGYREINATIRAENEGGQIYYQSRGFERMTSQIPLDPRVHMRFTLD
jgi:L-amino acid N-acyltransferase YncA